MIEWTENENVRQRKTEIQIYNRQQTADRHIQQQRQNDRQNKWQIAKTTGRQTNRQIEFNSDSCT